MLVVAWCGARSEAQPPIAKVVVAQAEVKQARPTVTLVGTVGPVRRSGVGAEIAEIVRAMPVREGDLVEKGGLLCKLDDVVMSFRLLEARARWGTLTARHEELMAGTRAEELRRLAALVEEARAEHERWKLEMVRVDGLYQGRVANQKEVYDTRAELAAAEQRLVAAQAQDDMGRAGPRQEVIAQAAHAVAAQQAVVNRLEAELQRTEIRAPFRGFVVKRGAEVGEWVEAGNQVVEMIDLASVLVRVDVPESALPFLAVGDAARIYVDALQRSFDGRIKHIIRQADERARTFPVEIELDNADLALAGGMFARASVAAGEAKDVVSVPKDALVERDGTTYVGTVMPGREGGMVGVLMAVTTGGDIGDWIAITSGNIEPGLTIITRGTENMMPFPKPVIVVDERGVPVAANKTSPGDSAPDSPSHGRPGGDEGR